MLGSDTMFYNVWQWLKNNLLSTMMGVLVFIYIAAWALNAIFGMKFDLPQLLELAKYVLAKFGVDSVFNTAMGSNKPKENVI